MSRVSKPKGVSRKSWQTHLEVCEMNRRIIDWKRKNSMYVENDLEQMLYDDGEYKATVKRRRKKK